MRTTAILGLAAAAFFCFAGSADAARWCHTSAGARDCSYASRAQCARIARRVGGACRRLAARRTTPGRAPYHAAPAFGGFEVPGQIYPSRPYWSSPYECYTDEGQGRFRPCTAGGDGGGGGRN